MKTLAEDRRDFAGNALTRMKRLRGIKRFALLLALTEGVILLIAWAGKAYSPALHVDCVSRVIGGIQYVCKQPSVDVPANYDVGGLVASLPDIVLEIAIVVGVSLLITAAVHLSLGRIFHRRPTDGAVPQGDLDPTAVHLETSARPEGTRGRRPGPLALARPKPLFLALGVAVAWAILSVGSALGDDVAQLIPQDKITVPTQECPLINYALQGSACVSTISRSNPYTGVTLPPVEDPPQPVLRCGGLLGGAPEPDNMCHQRSGGDFGLLADDITRGVASGLVAFLAVGGALLLWPRLRVAGDQETQRRVE